jgi:hypothetical protein
MQNQSLRAAQLQVEQESNLTAVTCYTTMLAHSVAARWRRRGNGGAVARAAGYHEIAHSSKLSYIELLQNWSQPAHDNFFGTRQPLFFLLCGGGGVSILLALSYGQIDAKLRKSLEHQVFSSGMSWSPIQVETMQVAQYVEEEFKKSSTQELKFQKTKSHFLLDKKIFFNTRNNCR